ncbi:MAG: hypothetical protein JSS50_03665 [Proteobacteria bacterium]|nr:hypothetical protein [Pseudomonadota bacterium]
MSKSSDRFLRPLHSDQNQDFLREYAMTYEDFRLNIRSDYSKKYAPEKAAKLGNYAQLIQCAISELELLANEQAAQYSPDDYRALKIIGEIVNGFQRPDLGISDDEEEELSNIRKRNVRSLMGDGDSDTEVEVTKSKKPKSNKITIKLGEGGWPEAHEYELEQMQAIGAAVHQLETAYSDTNQHEIATNVLENNFEDQWLQKRGDLHQLTADCQEALAAVAEKGKTYKKGSGADIAECFAPLFNKANIYDHLIALGEHELHHMAEYGYFSDEYTPALKVLHYMHHGYRANIAGSDKYDPDHVYVFYKDVENYKPQELLPNLPRPTEEQATRMAIIGDTTGRHDYFSSYGRHDAAKLALHIFNAPPEYHKRLTECNTTINKMCSSVASGHPDSTYLNAKRQTLLQNFDELLEFAMLDLNAMAKGDISNTELSPFLKVMNQIANPINIKERYHLAVGETLQIYHPELPDMPKLTESQQNALGALGQLAEDIKEGRKFVIEDVFYRINVRDYGREYFKAVTEARRALKELITKGGHGAPPPVATKGSDDDDNDTLLSTASSSSSTSSSVTITALQPKPLIDAAIQEVRWLAASPTNRHYSDQWDEYEQRAEALRLLTDSRIRQFMINAGGPLYAQFGAKLNTLNKLYKSLSSLPHTASGTQHQKLAQKALDDLFPNLAKVQKQVKVGVRTTTFFRQMRAAGTKVKDYGVDPYVTMDANINSAAFTLAENVSKAANANIQINLANGIRATLDKDPADLYKRLGGDGDQMITLYPQGKPLDELAESNLKDPLVSAARNGTEFRVKVTEAMSVLENLRKQFPTNLQKAVFDLDIEMRQAIITRCKKVLAIQKSGLSKDRIAQFELEIKEHEAIIACRKLLASGTNTQMHVIAAVIGVVTGFSGAVLSGGATYAIFGAACDQAGEALLDLLKGSPDKFIQGLTANNPILVMLILGSAVGLVGGGIFGTLSAEASGNLKGGSETKEIFHKQMYNQLLEIFRNKELGTGIYADK